MGEAGVNWFKSDNAALQWCVNWGVHVLITPKPNSMEPYVVRLWKGPIEMRDRVSAFREAVAHFAREHGEEIEAA